MDEKWKKRLAFFSIGMFFFIGGVEYAVILPTLWLYIKTDFHAQEYMLGLLLSAYSFAAMISGPILGRWSDKSRKPKMLILLGIVCEIAGNIMYFMGISVWFLLASRLVAGVGGGAQAVLMGEVTRTSEEKKRTGIISLLVAIRQTGLLIGPGLNLFLREMNFKVDGFQVDKYNDPGAFMACVWVLLFFLFVIFYTDLHKLKFVSDGKIKSTFSNKQSSRSPKGYHHGNSSRIDYDEDVDIYKEIIAQDNTDRRSINSAASSRSPINNPDDLIETAEDFIVEGHSGSRSHTPASINSIPSIHSAILVNSGRSSVKNSATDENGMVATETGDYGTFENSLSIPDEERRSRHGSQDYIASREESLTDYLQGKSKLRFIYHEYVREEVITVIAVQFNSFFNQVALETMVTPLTAKLLNWGELENSIMYCVAGVEIISVFGLVTWLSKRIQDRVLILIGAIVLTAANTWMIYVIPLAENGSHKDFLWKFIVGTAILMLAIPFLTSASLSLYSKLTSEKSHDQPSRTLWKFIIGVALDMFALPLLVSGSISLYSKVTKVETQGLSMGLRRSVVGMATILGPLWAGSSLNMPYIMFGAMLGLLVLSLLMLTASFSKLRPLSEMPTNQAGLVTTEDSDENITQPLIS